MSSPSLTSGRHTALLAFSLLVLIWGSNWVVVKIGLRYAGPFDFAALRGACAVCGLFGALLVFRQPLRPRAVAGILLLGLLQNTAFLTLTNLALVTGGAGKTAVLVFTMPFWTLLLAWPCLGEKVRGREWGAMLLALGGLVLLLEPWAFRSSLLSKSCSVLAGIAWAASVIVAKRLRARCDLNLLTLTAWQMAFGVVPLIALALLVPEPAVVWSGPFVGALLYAGLVATVVGWLLWLFILHRLPASTASLNSLAIPVVAVLGAWLVFRETPTTSELLGMLAIGLALLLLTALKTWPRPAPPAP